MRFGHQPPPSDFTLMEYRFSMPDIVVAARAKRPGIQAGALVIASLALPAGLICFGISAPTAASDSDWQTF